jgi:hypothetical protein
LKTRRVVGFRFGIKGIWEIGRRKRDRLSGGLTLKTGLIV